MRCPGQQYDSVTGFNYNYFRDYEPATGRYAQSDPIGLAGGVSTYGYVGGNALNSTDFYGLVARVCRNGNNVVIVQPVNFQVGPGVTREAAERVFIEAERAWTGRFGRYNVQLRIMDGRRDPDAVRVRLHHYVPGSGDSINLKNWHIPNPSDGRNWDNYDWSVYGHEVAHDLIGFSDNMGYDKGSVMSRRTGAAPAFVVTEFDVELLLDSHRVIHDDEWESCKCARWP